MLLCPLRNIPHRYPFLPPSPAPLDMTPPPIPRIIHLVVSTLNVISLLIPTLPKLFLGPSPPPFPTRALDLPPQTSPLDPLGVEVAVHFQQQ